MDGPSSPSSVHTRWVSARLDGEVYAQPLVVGDRIVVATENDTVYSLNATDGAIVWQRHVGEPVSGSSLPCGDVDPVGITGTPVLDARTNRLYAVGLIQPTRDVLFALDAMTGRVVASVGVDANGFDPAVQNQRGALTLSRGTIFVPYGGRYGDCGDYHGRLVTVAPTASGFGKLGSYTLPTQREGGFWAPPGPVVAPDGSVYLASGNSSSSSSYDYGNSVVRLTPNLRLVDSWAPTDWATLNASDSDVGSTSPVLLPGNRVFQIGKQGIGYLLDASHLGRIGGEIHVGDICRGAGVFGGIAHDGNTVFVPCTNAVVQVTVNRNSFSTGWTTPISTPGPTVIANAVVWTIATDSGDLIALDQTTGRTLSSKHLGHVPSRFTSPAIGDNQVIAAAGRAIYAIGN
jgi:outer membrane protein assembly factor BamB